MENEIDQLKAALRSTPENEFIRKLLIDKLMQQGNHVEETEIILKESQKLYPENSFYTEQLIAYYFKQSKFSVCITIYENFTGSDISNQLRAMISEAYLEIDEFQKSKELYFQIIDLDASFEHEKLDRSFKLNTVSSPDQQAQNQNDNSHLFIKSEIKFKDVGGLDDIKRQIDLKIIKPYQNQDLFKKYGKKSGGGLLFFGPPGCGKTFIAKATAGELESNFIAVGLNDILDMYLGNSEKNIHKYFNIARENKPCVLFIDEIDALGGNRESHGIGAGKNVVNQFLSEMDGIKSDNDGVLILGATNSPWQIDNALLRPGRFGNIIFVPPPDTEAKEKILKLKLQNRPIDDINYSKILPLTHNFSGADIDAIIELAIENILEEAIKTGKERNVKTSDLIEVCQKLKPSTLQWFSIAKNYVEYANKSGLYDDVKTYLAANKLL